MHAKIISQRLGHADIRITMDTYGHVLEAAGNIDTLFKQKKAPNRC
ncbi:hypothetical protein [Thalassobacillus pellis]